MNKKKKEEDEGEILHTEVKGWLGQESFKKVVVEELVTYFM